LGADRGPLRFIVLATTGEDVRTCTACECCYVDEALEAKLDLSLPEVLAATRENDEAALTNQSIWALAEAGPGAVRCVNDLDVVAIAQVLCREAQLRGLAGSREALSVKREASNVKRQT
jgi:heterodisulfide reductase subunit C